MTLTKGSKFVKATLLGLILLVATAGPYFRARTWTWPLARQEDREVREWSRCPRWPLGRTWAGSQTSKHLLGSSLPERIADNDFSRNRRIDRDRDGDFDRFDVLQSTASVADCQRFERRDQRYARRW